jgi:hypothetical protein
VKRLHVVDEWVNKTEAYTGFTYRIPLYALSLVRHSKFAKKSSKPLTVAPKSAVVPTVEKH